MMHYDGCPRLSTNRTDAASNLTDAERRVARAEQESVDLEVRSPRLPCGTCGGSGAIVGDDGERSIGAPCPDCVHVALVLEAKVSHVRDGDYHDCKWCRSGVWPCLPIRLADAVEAQAAEIARLQGERYTLATEVEATHIVLDGLLDDTARDQFTWQRAKALPTRWAYEQACKALAKNKVERDALRARVAEWKADHERAVELIDTLTQQRDYAQESARLYEITYGEEGTRERTTLRAERDALRVRVAEYDTDKARLAFIEQEGGCHFDDGVWSFGGIDVQCRDLNTATDAARAIVEDVENES
jgi:hypothetical protein